MAYLTAAEIASMQGVINTTLPGTAVIQGVTNASDSAGGVTPTWAAVAGGTVACRHEPQKRGMVTVVGGAEGAIFDSIFILPSDAPVAVNRRIIHAGVTYEIRDLATDQDWQLCQKVYAAMVSEENL